MRSTAETDAALDPCSRIKKFKTGSAGFRTWTEDQIDQFYGRHHQGSRARIALDLLLNTGQRRQDIVRRGWQNVRGDFLVIKRSKSGTEVSIPIRGDFKGLLNSLPRDRLCFIVGQRQTSSGIGSKRQDCHSVFRPTACARVFVGASPKLAAAPIRSWLSQATGISRRSPHTRKLRTTRSWPRARWQLSRACRRRTIREHQLSNPPSRFDNIAHKPLRSLVSQTKMVGPEGLEPPTKRL